MTAEALTLRLPPVQTTSVVFASPHSGRRYTPEFLRQSVLDERGIRSSEDAFVDDLIASVTDLGAASILARAPRAYIDLNRAEDELDASLIAGLRKGPPNPRIAAGLGVVPRVVSNGRAIYRGKITLAEAQGRIARFWRPYHATLQGLMAETRTRFGEAILIDCHSMPHEAIASLWTAAGRAPDVVLGDRFGAAARGDLVEAIEAIFEGEGFTVARNAPFAGAYISQAYGRPGRDSHAVQVEIDRALYMNEADVTPHGGYAACRARLARVWAAVAELGRPAVSVMSGLAAE